MSDETVTRIARNLAKALIHFAHERDDESKKRVAALQTELCAAYRDEQKEIERDGDEARP